MACGRGIIGAFQTFGFAASWLQSSGRSPSFSVSDSEASIEGDRRSAPEQEPPVASRSRGSSAKSSLEMATTAAAGGELVHE